MTKLPREVIAFQDPLDQVIMLPAPLSLRLWPFLAAMFTASLTIIAALLPIDVVVTASGRLEAALPPVQLKPYSSAILREVLVRPGDIVTPGQVLARLDTTFTSADRAILAADLASARAEIARLEAELSGRPLGPGSFEIGLQAELMEERAALASAQRTALTAEVEALQTAREAVKENGTGLEQRVNMAREILDMRLRLEEAQATPRLAVIDARVEVLAAEADLRRHLGQMESLRRQIQAAEARVMAFEHDRRRSLLAELAAARPMAARLTEELAKADAISAGTEITAPRPGVVLTVAEASAGSLIGAGETVVVVVPTDVPLVAEISLRSADSGRIAAGDRVSVKVDAFPWRQHGHLVGTLTEIGRDSTALPQGGPAYHMARVSFGPGPLKLDYMPPGTSLLPGMTMTADIHAGTRSVLDYLLDPLLRGLRESFREP
jgi:hemolysin D